MRRSRTTILNEYESFVKAFEQVCKVLGWHVTFKQDVDKMLNVVIDSVTYIIAPQINNTPEFPLYCLSVLYEHHGNRHEPPSVDDKIIMEGARQPRKIISALIDIHWIEKRQWALEQDWIPEDEKDQW